MVTNTFPDCTQINFNNREDWLAARRIGASDTAGIFGKGYRGQSAVSIWEGKRSGVSSVEETRRMRTGRYVEPLLREFFEEENGLECSDLGLHVLQSNEYDWMTSTLDGVVMRPGTGLVPSELKDVDARLLPEWRDQPPLKFQIQCQHQLGC